MKRIHYLQAHKDEIIALMRDYLNGKIDVLVFGRRISDYRREAIEEEDRIREGWPRRFDLDLIDQYTKGKITREQYSEKQQELWGYADRQWLKIFDSLYSDLDRLELDEAIREESKKEPVEWNATYYISEDEFKTQVQKSLEMVQAKD